MFVGEWLQPQMSNPKPGLDGPCMSAYTVPSFSSLKNVPDSLAPVRSRQSVPSLLFVSHNRRRLAAFISDQATSRWSATAMGTCFGGGTRRSLKWVVYICSNPYFTTYLMCKMYLYTMNLYFSCLDLGRMFPQGAIVASEDVKNPVNNVIFTTSNG